MTDSKPLRINVGSGAHKMAGYVSVDAYDPAAEVHADAAQLPYGAGTVDEIYTSHMVEHLAPAHFRRALQEWRRVLKPGGKLQIRCPNIEVYLRRWLAGDDTLRFGEGLHWLIGVPDKGDGYLNRNLFTPRHLAEFVRAAGFEAIRCTVYPTRSGHIADGDCLCQAVAPRS